MTSEIIVPLGVREFLPHWVEETMLGQTKGALKQYRYGNLHIRKYDDCYKVHVDHTDPRKNPLEHLIRDAPEFLAAAFSVPILAFGSYCALQWFKRSKKAD